VRYVQRTDGEGWNVPEGKLTRLACCDCGLVHDIVFVTDPNEPGEIGVAVQVNKRATAQKRRHMKPKP
jgi:hypothetical protein